ncbi:MAG: hypothetical protein ABW137_08625 [Mycobacterium sp.]
MQPPDDGGRLGNGTIQLRTTERGLPIALALAPQALSVPPSELARRILALCEVSARRMQVARRRELLASGCAPDVVDSLNLSTEEELRRVEGDVPAVDTGEEHDELPETWLRRL